MCKITDKQVLRVQQGRVNFTYKCFIQLDKSTPSIAGIRKHSSSVFEGSMCILTSVFEGSLCLVTSVFEGSL